MPVYEFRCDQSHVHELALPMTSSQRTAQCPQCGGSARRLISAPGLSRLNSARGRLIESTEASASAPSVVDAVPASGARRATPVSRDPRHAKLPRP